MVWQAVLGSLASGAVSGAFNAHSANKQMQFQERMSNTAYQRAANDLEKAGLNRILAIGNAATTPSGSSASINMPDLGSVGTQAASAKSAISLQGQQKQLIAQQKELLDQQEMTEYWKTQTANAEANAAQKWADEQAAANLLLTRAQTGLAANNARTAGAEADFQEGLGDTGKALYEFLKNVGLGGVPAKLIPRIPMKR